jgi:hypothetical protein
MANRDAAAVRSRPRFEPTDRGFSASKFVCWCLNPSASGFAVMCCGRCCALCGVALRHDDWPGVWRWAWWWGSIRLWG